MARAIATGRHAAGRPIVSTSKTQLALQQAVYLVRAEGMSLNAASKISAAAYGLSSSDNLRSLLRKALVGPQSTIKPGKKHQGTWFGLVSPKTQSVFVGVVDVVSKKITPNTADPDGLEQLDSIVSGL
jgi:hypothetical protein